MFVPVCTAFTSASHSGGSRPTSYVAVDNPYLIGYACPVMERMFVETFEFQKMWADLRLDDDELCELQGRKLRLGDQKAA
jgi:hypothetical protein